LEENSLNYDFKYNFESEIYHNSREEFFEIYKLKIVQYLNDFVYFKDNKKSRKLFIIVDDNFYYKSMRKPFYKFLKNLLKEEVDDNKNSVFQCSYLEIILKCDLNYAKKNNEKRKLIEHIPDIVIKRMFDKMEYESFIKNFVILFQINTEDNLKIEILRKERFMEFILDEIILSKFLIAEIIKSEYMDYNNTLKKCNEIQQNMDLEEYNNPNVNKKLKNEMIPFFKKNFINDLENSLRKKIGDLYKRNIDKITETRIKQFKLKLSKNNDLELLNESFINDFKLTEEVYFDDMYLNIIIAVYNKNKNIFEKEENSEYAEKKKLEKKDNKIKPISKFISSLKDFYLNSIKCELLNFLQNYELNEEYNYINKILAMKEQK